MSSIWDNLISTLAQKLGYVHLKDWQADLTRKVLDGNDVVLTAGTGSGKSTLLFAPLLAKREVDGKAVGLSVALTKALGEDQVYLIPTCCHAFQFLMEYCRHIPQHQKESQALRLMKTHCEKLLLRHHHSTCLRKCWG
jgi:ATP-dependent helicase YprA (DUF1998 family)